MANPLTAETERSRLGWAFRLMRSFGTHADPGVRTSVGVDKSSGLSNSRDSSMVRGMTRKLIADDRYVFVLLKEAAGNVGEADASLAWGALAEDMALIPSGVVPVVHCNGGTGPVEIPAFYLDRHAVTNRQFQRFVDSGGYDSLEIWPQEVWPSLMKFVDQSRKPGPREWQDGKFPHGKAEHPVVGVCWYESAAYAAWVGKRLPSSAEWQKAGGWPEHYSGGACHRYPWGDVYEPARANLGPSGAGKTVPVLEYAHGATPNGIYQMTGNVWEWISDPLDVIPCRPDEAFVPIRPMRRIVGGAFDTYFHAEATNQFITGQPELDRRENIGFRCVVSVGKLRIRP